MSLTTKELELFTMELDEEQSRCVEAIMDAVVSTMKASKIAYAGDDRLAKLNCAVIRYVVDCAPDADAYSPPLWTGDFEPMPNPDPSEAKPK